MEKRARKESQANAALQKDVDVLRSKLAERERALAERDEALVKVKRQYARIKQGGSDECSLEELEELDKVLGTRAHARWPVGPASMLTTSSPWYLQRRAGMRCSSGSS
jgi:hypothetical protein